jgi:DNA/RNA-binding domain of Phe-tRNA-synthetase-like protein
MNGIVEATPSPNVREPMRTISIAAISERFPQFRLALIVAYDLKVKTERSAALECMIDEAQNACRARWSGVELSAIASVAAWRTAYRGFGIKKTSYRSSVERLIKRVLAGGELPRVNNLVDLYNCVSLNYGQCLGADDFDKTSGDLTFRFAQAGDTFVDMSAEPGEDPNDPAKEGEVVYADSRHVLCRRWNWRQDARTVVTVDTKNVILTVQSNGFGEVETTAETLMRGIGMECGGQWNVVVLDRSNPSAPF